MTLTKITLIKHLFYLLNGYFYKYLKFLNMVLKTETIFTSKKVEVSKLMDWALRICWRFSIPESMVSRWSLRSVLWQKEKKKITSQTTQFPHSKSKHSFNVSLTKRANKKHQLHFSNNRKHLNTLLWKRERGRSPERSKLWWRCHRERWGCWPHHISIQSEVGVQQRSKRDWVIGGFNKSTKHASWFKCHATLHTSAFSISQVFWGRN